MGNLSNQSLPSARTTEGFEQSQLAEGFGLTDAHRQFHVAGGFARSFNFMQPFSKGRMVVLPKAVRLIESTFPPPTSCDD